MNNKNNNNNNNNTSANATRPVYVDRNGNVQQPRQQRRPQQQMARPQKMQRPQPVTQPVPLVERQEMARKQWLARIVKGTGHKSYNWLYEEPENPGQRVKVVSRPVVAKTEPVVAKRAEKRRRSLSREDLAEAFALEKTEMTDAYLASIARQHKLQAELTQKKAELVALGLVKKGEVVPDAFKRNGIFLSFEVGHELAKARSVIGSRPALFAPDEEGAEVMELSEAAMKDPTNPWRQQADLGIWIAGILRKVIAEVKANPMVRPDHGVWTRRTEVEADYDAIQNEFTSRRYVPAGKRKARPERAPRIAASLGRTAPVKVAQTPLPVAADGPVARPEPEVVDLRAVASYSRRVW